MNEKLKDSTIQEIVQLYTLDNISASEIARRLHIGLTVVRKYLTKAGIKLKSKKERVRNKEMVTDIINMYQSGLTQEEIKERTKLCLHTIREILKENHIEPHDRSYYKTYTIDQNYFESLDTSNKCYVLGFLYADGSVSKKNYNLRLILQERDKYILEKIKEDMKSNAPLHFKKSKNPNVQNAWGICVDCKKICQDLVKLGIVPNKTFKLKYPDFLTNEQHSHFLRGVMDGDGHIIPYNGHNGAVIICGTYDFCNGAKEVIESMLNIKCYVRPHKNIYNLCVYGRNQVRTFLDWIYQDAELYLKRKYETYCEGYKNEVA